MKKEKEERRKKERKKEERKKKKKITLNLTFILHIQLVFAEVTVDIPFQSFEPVIFLMITQNFTYQLFNNYLMNSGD